MTWWFSWQPTGFARRWSCESGFWYSWVNRWVWSVFWMVGQTTLALTSTRVASFIQPCLGQSHTDSSPEQSPRRLVSRIEWRHPSCQHGALGSLTQDSQGLSARRQSTCCPVHQYHHQDQLYPLYSALDAVWIFLRRTAFAGICTFCAAPTLCTRLGR